LLGVLVQVPAMRGVLILSRSLGVRGKLIPSFCVSTFQFFG
jgi:hypothetical protein